MFTPSYLIHISETDGHHRNYQELFARLLGGRPITGKIRWNIFRQLAATRHAFFATIDSNYFGFILVCVVRSMKKKPTTGIFISPHKCFLKNQKITHRLKYLAFKMLRKMPHVRVISIIPYDIEPKLGEVSHDWIFDPQIWDLWIDGPPLLPETELSNAIEQERKNRKIIIFIGTASRIKGFNELAAMAEQRSKEYLIVIAGKISNEYAGIAEHLQANGTIVENRYITDEEILSLYRVADYAWCRYSEEYDQASGVFGRALQTAVIPIIRDGSILSKFLQIYFDEKYPSDRQAIHAKISLFREASIEKLKENCNRQ